MTRVKAILALIGTAIILSGCRMAVNDGAMARGETAEVRAVDHMVPHVSTVPANKDERVQLYVREKFAGDTTGKPVVLMVHGGWAPAKLSFDVERGSYSWMSYLASAGFDVFAMDMTGYGKSSRPKMMDDPCNVEQAQQKTLIPRTLPAECKPTYPHELMNSQSESDDIDRVVEYIRKLRGAAKVNLIGWSGGGIRTGTYTSRYPEKVEKLVILASSNYSRKNPSGPPTELPKAGAAIRIQSREVAEKLWFPNAKCDGQIASGMPDHIWELKKSQDPVGMTWGPGVLRDPLRTYWGWNAETAKKLKLPTLILVGEYDPQTVSNKELYEDLGSDSKVFVGIACASHYVVWEKQHGAVHQASREWLAKGTFNGASRGMFRIDPQGRFVAN
jgi:pimeloyl-ACP methyl ester carboxylesterase